MMKKILIGLGVVVALLVVAAVAVPMLVPLETYERQLAQRVEAATGRKFAIAGDVSLSVLPRLELEANGVSLSNPPGAKQANMAELSKLRMRLALLPLLSGEVVLDSFVLVEPVINLEVDAQGRPNWRFGEPKAAAAEPETGGGGGAPPALREISLGDVRLVDGRLTYRDARTGETQTVEDVDMAVSLPSLDQPLQADGALTWNAERVTLEARIAEPRALMEGGTTAVEATIDSAPATASYAGTVTNGGGPLSLKGGIDLDVPSIRALAAWAGTPLAGGGSGLGRLAIAGDIAMNGPKVAFTGATIALDEMTGTGDLRLDLSGGKPSIVAALEVDAIDLNRYLPPPAEATGAPASGEAAQSGSREGGSQEGTPDEGWSEAPIDLSALRAANAEITVRAGGITVRDIELGETRARAVLADGKLALDLLELALYGGTGKGGVTLDGTGETPALAAAFELSDLKAAPFLTDAAGFDRIEGTANMAIDVTTRGRSQKAMVSALDGTGRVQFLDGAIRGVNLAAMVRNVSNAFLDPEAQEAQKTDFAELAGTFSIADGIASNEDLFLKSPLLRLEGAGTVDLPRRTVDYRVTPKLVASLEGQGGAEQLAGVAVPVTIKGPWTDLTYAPDLSGAVNEIAKDPAKALETLKGLAGETEEGSGDGATDSDSAPSAEDVIKGLFGQ